MRRLGIVLLLLVACGEDRPQADREACDRIGEIVQAMIEPDMDKVSRLSQRLLDDEDLLAAVESDELTVAVMTAAIAGKDANKYGVHTEAAMEFVGQADDLCIDMRLF